MSYYSKVLYPFLIDLISDYDNLVDHDGHFNLSVDDLSTYHLRQFSAHLVELNNRDLNAISENNCLDDISISVIKMLKKNNKENCMDFAELVQEKIIEYYKPSMQSLIDEVIYNLEQDFHYENGSTLHHRKDNGESYWSATL